MGNRQRRESTQRERDSLLIVVDYLFVHTLGRESGRVNLMRNLRILLLKLGMTIKRMTSNRKQHFQRWGQ